MRQQLESLVGDSDTQENNMGEKDLYLIRTFHPSPGCSGRGVVQIPLGRVQGLVVKGMAVKVA